ncbi:MAG: hypothetical protein HEQ39_02380 [Rhizobacter sp.]
MLCATEARGPGVRGSKGVTSQRKPGKARALPFASSEQARVFSATGQVAVRYDKMHLFCFDNGRERYDEGQVLQAGQTPVACDMAIPGAAWRLGLSVCYDLRFPELYRHLMKPPCDNLPLELPLRCPQGKA